MAYKGELLEQARLVKRHYPEPHAGELFADIERQIANSQRARIPRWLPKVFQHVLNDFVSLDELSRTDFLSCLLRLYRALPVESRNLKLDALKESRDLLPAWDLELVKEVLKVENALA